jgi:hypothetical protein
MSDSNKSARTGVVLLQFYYRLVVNGIYIISSLILYACFGGRYGRFKVIHSSSLQVLLSVSFSQVWQKHMSKKREASDHPDAAEDEVLYVIAVAQLYLLLYE